MLDIARRGASRLPGHPRRRMRYGAGGSSARFACRNASAIVSAKGDILSPDGHCRAFDADAQGTIFGSGVGAVLLKDLGAAIADRDHIYAVIRGSAINNDGADKISYTASSVAGQARAMVEAMLMADVSPGRRRLCRVPWHRHDRRRSAGDRCPDARVPHRNATGRGFCAIGSVKTNIGHLEQTAGIAGLIKTALALKNGKIPPSLNFRTPNPKIDFAASPFFVNTQVPRLADGDRPRLAAVNSLGLGGTNAFACSSRAAGGGPRRRDEPHAGTCSRCRQGRVPRLRASIERHLAWLARRSERRSARYLLHLHQRAKRIFPHRFAAVAGSIAQLRDGAGRGTANGAAPSDRHRRAPARLPVLRASVAIRGYGGGALSASAGISRRSRSLRRDRCASRLERPLLTCSSATMRTRR